MLALFRDVYEATDDENALDAIVAATGSYRFAVWNTSLEMLAEMDALDLAPSVIERARTGPLEDPSYARQGAAGIRVPVLLSASRLNLASRELTHQFDGALP